MKKICDISIGAIGWISGAVALILFLSNLIFTTYVDYQTELVSIEADGVLFLVPGILILLILLWIAKSEIHIKEWQLFLVGSVLWLCAGGYFVANCDGTLRFDSLYCYETAYNMNIGDFSALRKDGYLYYCPHQLGFVTYERVLLALGGQTKTILGCNFLWIVGSQYLLWRLSDLLFDRNQRVNVITIALGFSFLPLFLFGMFAYGMIPGLFFMMGAFSSAIAYLKKRKFRYLIMLAGTSVLAVLLKENYLIGVLAIMIFGILANCKKRDVKGTVIFALLLPICLLSIRALQLCYLLESGDVVGSGIPRALYIGMGINIHNESTGPGWYDGSVWSYFDGCDQDYEAASALAQRNLQIYVQQMQDKPVRTMEFFLRKMVSMWSDPLCDSVWSGPMESCGQYCETTFLQSLYRGETVNTVCRCFMKAYMLVLLGLCSVYRIRRRKTAREADMLLLYTVGGFLFHMVWEAKSQYAFPYVCVLIPIASYAIGEFFQKKVQNF